MQYLQPITDYRLFSGLAPIAPFAQVFLPLLLIFLAGTPATAMFSSSTSLLTTAFAPIATPFATCVFPRITAP